MKPQSLSGDNSLIGESERRIWRGRLKQMCQAAMDAMVPSGVQRGHRILISKVVERRSWRCSTEDPIRTMMFLGSWSHT
ncbi:Uncharacterized protein TCM_004602 [Theobroma cacao]|uniref:Uncharacterized protein n=1 Tax=Theobroma cacao TaxID=3641 RepID=A0A061DSE3_THECC|nr:Uncharacterized protein TCM_004602 [Theobroma cacao]